MADFGRVRIRKKGNQEKALQTKAADVLKKQTRVAGKIKQKASEEAEQPFPKESVSEKKMKKVYTELLLDTTISMSCVYKRVYQILRSFIQEIKRQSQLDVQTVYYLGLTCITEDGPKPYRFANEIYTKDTEAFMDALKHLQFQGGSPDGYEKICESIELSLRKLGDVKEPEAYKGLILISDSIPKESSYDFRIVDGMEMPLHFARCFLYDCMEFVPFFEMVKPASDLLEAVSSSVSDLSDLLHNEQEIMDLFWSIQKIISGTM